MNHTPSEDEGARVSTAAQLVSERLYVMSEMLVSHHNIMDTFRTISSTKVSTVADGIFEQELQLLVDSVAHKALLDWSSTDLPELKPVDQESKACREMMHHQKLHQLMRDSAIATDTFSLRLSKMRKAISPLTDESVLQHLQHQHTTLPETENWSIYQTARKHILSILDDLEQLNRKFHSKMVHEIETIQKFYTGEDRNVW